MKYLHIWICLTLFLTIANAAPEPDWQERQTYWTTTLEKQFKPPIRGDSITIYFHSGGSKNGILKSISSAGITITLDVGDLQYPRDSLHPQTRALLYKDEFVSYGVKQKLASERKAYAEGVEKVKRQQTQALQKLLQNVTVKHDDIQEVAWYETQRDTRIRMGYATFKVELYIGKHDSGILTFRMRTRFFEEMSDAHDPTWIFYESVRLLGDNGARLDITTEYPNKQQDNDRTGLEEWSDNNVPAEAVLKFKTAQSVKVMFNGRYSHTFDMSSQQLSALREMIAVYEYLKLNS